VLRAFVVVGLLLAIGVTTIGAVPAERSARRCPVTIPTTSVPRDAGFSAAGFNYGNSRLRAHLYWPRGRLTAGILPDGGAMATIQKDGSIWAKVGWWVATADTLVVTGRRLDGSSRSLRASVPYGYGLGFQPVGLTFPTVGCWRVVGRAGSARLKFVVEVTEVRRSTS